MSPSQLKEVQTIFTADELAMLRFLTELGIVSISQLMKDGGDEDWIVSAAETMKPIMLNIKVREFGGPDRFSTIMQETVKKIRAVGAP